MELVVKPFGELTPWELYELLRLRVDVFVVEQRCPYPELDGKDPASLHLFLREGEEILAYLRVLTPGLAFPEAALGRVVTRDRGRGLGRQILEAGISAVRERLGASALTIEAQTYAKGFYEAAGFRQASQEFLEDGIPHILMRLELGAVPEKEEGPCGI